MRGVQTWIAPDSIPIGIEWKPQIVSAILDSCTHFLVIISESAIKSDWVLKEISLAKKKYKRDNNFKILPLYVGNAQNFPNEAFINQFQKVPYYDDFILQLEAITEAIGISTNISRKTSPMIEDKIARRITLNKWLRNLTDEEFESTKIDLTNIDADVRNAGKRATFISYMELEKKLDMLEEYLAEFFPQRHP